MSGDENLRTARLGVTWTYLHPLIRQWMLIMRNLRRPRLSRRRQRYWLNQACRLAPKLQKYFFS